MTTTQRVIFDFFITFFSRTANCLMFLLPPPPLLLLLLLSIAIIVSWSICTLFRALFQYLFTVVIRHSDTLHSLSPTLSVSIFFLFCSTHSRCAVFKSAFHLPLISLSSIAIVVQITFQLFTHTPHMHQTHGHFSTLDYFTSDFRFFTFAKCEQNANNDYKEVEERGRKGTRKDSRIYW